MVDFLFGKDMKKKDLIVMLPLFVALVVLVWILAGQEEALILLCSLLFTPTLGLVLTKWIEFVGKHIKD